MAQLGIFRVRMTCKLLKETNQSAENVATTVCLSFLHFRMYLIAFSFPNTRQYVTAPSETAKSVDIGIWDLNMFKKFCQKF